MTLLISCLLHQLAAFLIKLDPGLNGHKAFLVHFRAVPIKRDRFQELKNGKGVKEVFLHTDYFDISLEEKEPKRTFPGRGIRKRRYE